jgi:hypothetical protein
MQTLSTIGVIVASFAFYMAPAQATPFEGSGELIQGVECVLFKADVGGRYVLDNLDGFQVGDRVHVTGDLNLSCVTICQEGDGCISDTIIQPPVIQCQINGTAQKVGEVTSPGEKTEKNGQVSIHMTCDGQKVALGPRTGKNQHPTYARLTSVLRDEAGIEYVNETSGTPLVDVCLQARNGGNEFSAKYEAAVGDMDLARTAFSITVSRKDVKDCSSGTPCSRSQYTSQLRVDRAQIDDTTPDPADLECMFTTEFQIFKGLLPTNDGACPAPDPLNPPLLAFSAEATWHNPDHKPGDCKVTNQEKLKGGGKLRTPIKP